MPYTVNACFEKFRKEVVDLDPDITTKAKTSRDYLISIIKSLATNKAIPSLYSNMEVTFYGSFARNTKIRPCDDIDLLITFNACGSTSYDITKRQNANYPITVPESADLLQEDCDDNILNSRKVIETIKKALNESKYGKADIHRNQEAVTLKMTSYDWNFDIVPSFYTSTEFFVIPDGNGSWKGTDPRIDQDRVTTENQNKSGNLLPLIRLMKYWKKKHWPNDISSYLFENLIINWSRSRSVIPSSYQEAVKSILEYLSLYIRIDFQDPKGFQGNINTLNTNGRALASQTAYSQLQKVKEAIDFEKNRITDEKAINEWRDIFGNDFPKYGA